MVKHIWISGALFITSVFGGLYIAVYQALRSGANDPQISIVRDIAAAVVRSRQMAELPDNRVNAEYDMSPFVIIYDKTGNPVAGNGYIDGHIPLMPLSMLQPASSDGGSHAATWEPKQGVRIASVSMKAGDYYVVSGRSLWVAENRIRSFTQYMVSSWLITILALATIGFMVVRGRKIP